MAIDKAFNKSAKHYDDWVTKAVPFHKDIFSIAVELISFKKDRRLKVLDLGAGTGLFSAHVFKKYPKATFLLYDIAPKMLEVAQNRFKRHKARFSFITGDYRKIGNPQKYDLVISSLSIHHLTDNEKRQLFKNVYAILKKSGVFINIDQVRGETKFLQKLYWTAWFKRLRESNAPEKLTRESVRRRNKYDKEASLPDQIKWLKEAGFTNVDCVYKNYAIGLFFAMKG